MPGSAHQAGHTATSHPILLCPQVLLQEEPTECLDVELRQQAMSAIAAMRYRPSPALANVVALVLARGPEHSITPLPSRPLQQSMAAPRGEAQSPAHLHQQRPPPAWP